MNVRGFTFFFRTSVVAWALLGAAVIGASASANESTTEVIVQAKSVEEAERIVQRVGGTVTGQLSIIEAVAAELTAGHIRQIQTTYPSARVYSDSPVSLSFSPGDRGQSRDERDKRDCDERRPESNYPTLIGADRLHEDGITGEGVTIAVVDTGLSPLPGLTRNATGDHRVLAQYDAIGRRENASAPRRIWDNDLNGHGTHVVSVMMSAQESCRGEFNGIAPGADLVSVRALDENGAGRYIDVIRGISWVVEHRT
ncbi:MAG TPA: S8 family serine peptidase, partial [Rhodothermia bacterium]|nr:S8 family serine peptidase [Rhodothermia bacterium]